MVMGEQDIINLISDDVWMMHILHSVRSLGLPDWCVCAGFVRSKVWDYLHEFRTSTPLSDVDVVFFNTNHPDEDIEKEYENILRGIDSSIPWSVKNQARMHVKNGHESYASTADGLSHFPEVCTAIGAYLDAKDEVRLISPYGIDDLINLVVRPTPFYTSEDKKHIYEQRMKTKKWHLTWNRLIITNS